MVSFGFDKSVLSVWNGLKHTLTLKGASMCLNGSDKPLIKGRTVVDFHFHSGGCVAGVDAHMEEESECLQITIPLHVKVDKHAWCSSVALTSLEEEWVGLCSVQQSTDDCVFWFLCLQVFPGFPVSLFL